MREGVSSSPCPLGSSWSTNAMGSTADPAARGGKPRNARPRDRGGGGAAAPPESRSAFTVTSGTGVSADLGTEVGAPIPWSSSCPCTVANPLPPKRSVSHLVQEAQPVAKPGGFLMVLLPQLLAFQSPPLITALDLAGTGMEGPGVSPFIHPGGGHRLQLCSPSARPSWCPTWSSLQGFVLSL